MTIIFLRLVSVGIGLLHNSLLHLVCAKKAENANMPLLSQPSPECRPKIPQFSSLDSAYRDENEGQQVVVIPKLCKMLVNLVNFCFLD